MIICIPHRYLEIRGVGCASVRSRQSAYRALVELPSLPVRRQLGKRQRQPREDGGKRSHPKQMHRVFLRRRAHEWVNGSSTTVQKGKERESPELVRFCLAPGGIPMRFELARLRQISPVVLPTLT